MKPANKKHTEKKGNAKNKEWNINMSGMPLFSEIKWRWYQTEHEYTHTTQKTNNTTNNERTYEEECPQQMMLLLAFSAHVCQYPTDTDTHSEFGSGTLCGLYDKQICSLVFRIRIRKSMVGMVFMTVKNPHNTQHTQERKQYS